MAKQINKKSNNHRFSVGGNGARGKAVQEKYNKMRGETGHLEFLEMLLSENLGLKFAIKGITKAEMQLKTWIRFGHKYAITASMLRKYSGVDLNTCKRVIQTDTANEQLCKCKIITRR